MIYLPIVDAKIDRKAVNRALDEKQGLRAHIYNHAFMNALENGVDETVVLLYAQCALDLHDQGFIQ